jgi:hypothetical protein
MRLCIFWAIALLVFVFVDDILRAEDKSSDVNEALLAIKKIYAFGEHNKWTEIKSYDSVSPIIDQLNRPAELEKCAVLCMEIASPMEAGDNGFDSYFYLSYGACVSKLAKIKGAEAGDALKTIEWAIHADGGEREFLDTCIESQKKL